jgi:RNA polymerase sigma-70 factor (ECF subfamily)
MSFEETYRAHFRFVWRSLRRLGVAEHDVQDAAQEVFVVVHKRLGEFEGRSNIRTWLFAICFRVAMARGRSLARRREVIDEGFLARIPSDAPSALTVVERRQAREIVEAILDRMSLEQRAVFVLFELEGMSGDEIAEALEVPVGTVRSRLRLARGIFSACVERMRAREHSLVPVTEAS